MTLRRNRKDKAMLIRVKMLVFMTSLKMSI
jgi:hypothetical protein